VIPLKDENPTRRAPVVTVLLLAACVGIYFFWQPSPLGDDIDDLLFSLDHAAIPCEVIERRPLTEPEVAATFGVAQQSDACGLGSSESRPYAPDKSIALSVLTSMFLHGSLLHLGGNLLFLWIFGNNIEDHLGPIRYLLFYVAAGVVATLTHVALNLDSTIPMVGASGAIAGVMGAYLVWFPDAPVRTLLVFFLILVVRVRAKWILGFWFVLQFFTSPNSGVAWAAHVGGFVFGVIVALIVRASRGARRAMWTSGYRSAPWDPTGGAGYGYFKR
jgi:membrane associated rhomboid family serine protease